MQLDHSSIRIIFLFIQRLILICHFIFNIIIICLSLIFLMIILNDYILIQIEQSSNNDSILMIYVGYHLVNNISCLE